MDIIDVYNQIPHELSGSRAKNRFRLELLWGISKVFDLFDREDFCIVFDYKCDIELHFSDSIEFYQIKTHKVQKPYSFSDIKKISKAEQQSVIAKLFLLQDIAGGGAQVKCALVSNAFFKINKRVYSDFESFRLSDLEPNDQETIKKALKEELGKDDIVLDELYYVYTSMNLLDPENDIKGKIAGSFEKIKGCEPVKINALYRLIVDTVEEKACYELSSADYDSLIMHKGLTKSELNRMLEQHMEKTDDSVAQVKAYIDQKDLTVGGRKKLNLALTRIVEAEYTSKELQQKELDVARYIETIQTDVSVDKMLKQLCEEFDSSFSVEYSSEERQIFLLLIIKRWESGKYE